MRVFVTGGMGFIGSYIVKALLDDGHQVTILARDPAKVPALQTTPGILLLPAGAWARGSAARSGRPAAARWQP